MVEIVPSINVATIEELKERIKLVEPFVDWVHLDVSDGTFTKHVSWHESKDLIGFETRAKIEVHLMIDKPEKQIKEWLITSISRLIFHQEATKNHDLLIEKIHQAGKEVGISIRPDTPWLKLFPYFGKVELLQVLAVIPGPSGQKFDEGEFNEGTIHKMGHIKNICHPCMIEVDGGINTQNAPALVKEGADILVVGNAIFNSTDVEKSIKELQEK